MRNRIDKIIIALLGILTLHAVNSDISAQEEYGNEREYREEVRIVPDSTVERIKNEKEFSYANDPAFWSAREQKQENDRLFYFIELLSRNGWIKWLLYVFLAAIFFFVIYQAAAGSGLFIFKRRSSKKVGAAGKQVAIDAEDIDSLIDAAIKEQAYRPATRYLFLRTLRDLDRKGKIKMNPGATNREYLAQVKEQGAASDFKKLSDIYEYVWYGEFQPDARQFGMIHHSFNQFMNRY